MEIPEIRIEGLVTRQVFIQDVPKWLQSQPTTSIPFAPPATVIIGSPIIDMPGCVEAHEQNENREKSGILSDDDPKGVKVFCDAGVPSYSPIDYTPDQLQMDIGPQDVPPIKSPPPPELETPEVPSIPSTEETQCPAPNQPRVGDLTQAGDERVVGHELQGTICVVLYEPTTVVEKFLPSTNQVSVTASIAVVATASAAATPLLLRVVKPVVKQLIKRIQKLFGKEPPKLSANELQTNRYREKKGLPPFKRPSHKKRYINDR